MNRSKLTYYAALFAFITFAFAAFVLYMRYFHGRTVLWKTDALPLYLNFFIYEGEWLREGFASLASGQGWAFPAYSFDMGYGADMFVAMNGMVSDPLNLVSAICPNRYAAHMLVLLILVRLLLASAAFSEYCFSKGLSRSQAFIGSICYATSGYVLFWGVLRHPGFLNVAILFPLLLMGIDRVFDRKPAYLLVASAALLFGFSLYHSYMVCLVLVAYCLLKFCIEEDAKSLRAFGSFFVRVAGPLVLAGLIAAVLWLPVLLTMMQMGRIGLERVIPVIDDFGYYLYLPLSWVGGCAAPRGAYIGPLPLVILLTVVLAGRNRLADKTWKFITAAFILCLVAMLVPAFGSAFNGFGYVTDRWMFAFGFLTSYSVAAGIPLIGKLRRKDYVGVAAVCLLLCAMFAAGAYGWKNPWAKQGAVCFVVVCVLVGCIVACTRIKRGGNHAAHAGLSQRAVVVMLMVPLLVGTASMLEGMFSSNKGDYVSEYMALDEPWTEMHHENVGRLVSNLDGMNSGGVSIDNDLRGLGDSQENPSRVSTPVIYGMKNATVAHGVMSDNFYSSFYNQYVDDFRTELGVSDHFLNYSFTGVDSRFALLSLTGSRYFIASDYGAWRTPLTYGPVDTGSLVFEGDTRYTVSETPYALPLVVGFDEAASEDAYRSLDMVQRQELLLHACVLNDCEADPTLKDFEGDSHDVDFDIGLDDGIVMTDGEFTVSDNGLPVQFTFQGKPNCEYYLVVEGLDFEGISPTEYAEMKGESVTWETRWKEWVWEAPSEGLILVGSQGNTRELRIANATSSAYGGKHDWVFMGAVSGDEPASEITLTFDAWGRYTFDSIRIVEQPVEPLVDQAEHVLSLSNPTIVLGNDTVWAKLDSCQECKYALVTVPYSEGWSATVNGEPAEVLRADTAFMAVALPGDEHCDVELHYVTPGLKAGALISAIGVTLAVVLTIRRRKARRRIEHDSV
ncbi:YfhO family protein [Slackia heliotrinireducens]|uniref:YfhO family protein n=1 Tax=Slackia heliotrinireducens TaxID=84110 RepID=UPI003315F48E